MSGHKLSRAPGSLARATAAILATVTLVMAALVIAAVATAAPTRPIGARPATLAAFTGRAEPALTALPTPDEKKADSKKGVGAWAFRGARSALVKSGVSWYYTWEVTHPGITTPRGVAFVPMIWGARSVTVWRLRKARYESRILLGFNEPDLASQSNMTVSHALRLWPRLMHTGMRLGSPAVAGGGATPGGWLARFMAGAASRHYRVNFITLHWYGQDFSTTAAVSQLESYIRAVWARYHKPIWLTEFALWKFNPSVFPSPRQQAAFVRAATVMLQRLPYVQRYAWFALPADSADGTVGLFRPGAVATAAGRTFEKVDS
jgi:hypothetical protein